MPTFFLTVYLNVGDNGNQTLAVNIEKKPFHVYFNIDANLCTRSSGSQLLAMFPNGIDIKVKFDFVSTTNSTYSYESTFKSDTYLTDIDVTLPNSFGTPKSIDVFMWVDSYTSPVLSSYTYFPFGNSSSGYNAYIVYTIGRLWLQEYKSSTYYVDSQLCYINTNNRKVWQKCNDFDISNYPPNLNQIYCNIVTKLTSASSTPKWYNNYQW